MKTKCLAVTRRSKRSAWAAPIVGVNADEESRGKLRATLKGFNETPANSTPASGSFRATLNDDSITFELTYSGLVADSPLRSHPSGPENVAGGVMIFFCDNSNPPHSPRTCPARSGTVTGTVTAADVIGPMHKGLLPVNSPRSWKPSIQELLT